MRKRYVNLVDSVRDSGGDVKIFSSLHVSGERKCATVFQLNVILLASICDTSLCCVLEVKLLKTKSEAGTRDGRLKLYVYGCKLFV